MHTQPLLAILRLLLLPLLLVLPFVNGCGTEEDPPVARIQILHSIEDLGTLEVLIDSKLLGSIQSQNLSSAFEVEPGNRQLSIRNQGAQVSILQENLTLGAQGYLFALTGRLSNNSLKLIKVDQPVPSLEKGEAALEVIHLFSGTFRFDVYAGGTLLAQNVGYSEPPAAFVKLPAGVVKVTAYNTGSDPLASLPVASKELSLGAGSATLLVLQTDGGALSINPINIQ
jgi:hypothetical protein